MTKLAETFLRTPLITAYLTCKDGIVRSPKVKMQEKY